MGKFPFITDFSLKYTIEALVLPRTSKAKTVTSKDKHSNNFFLIFYNNFLGENIQELHLQHTWLLNLKQRWCFSRNFKLMKKKIFHGILCVMLIIRRYTRFKCMATDMSMKNEESPRPYVDCHTKFTNMLFVSICQQEQCYKSHHLTQIIKLDNIHYKIWSVTLLKYVEFSSKSITKHTAFKIYKDQDFMPALVW